MRRPPLLACAAALGGTLVAPARADSPAVPHAARALVIRSDLDPVRSTARIRLDPDGYPGTTPTSSILIFNNANPSGEVACWTLSASNWHTRAGTLIYNDRSLGSSPVRRAVWQRGHLVLFLDGANPAQPLGYPVGFGPDQDVVVVLSRDTPQGALRDCYEISAATAVVLVERAGPDGVLRAVDAQAPTACPTPPVACPPGG
jgi:hypothetical protein